jgi:hypothetical protein
VPICLKDGRTIVTLDDARGVMDALPPSHRSQAIWRFTGLMLSDAALDPTLLSRAEELLTRALKVERLI